MDKIFGLLLCCCLLSLSGNMIGQDYDIGIRAGLARSKFAGPAETGVNEAYGLTGGFHFGINFQWNFNEFVGWRTEILYSQLGSSYKMNSDNGAYVFNDPINGIQDLVFRSESDLLLDHSNAYVLFPQTLHLTITDKFEVFGGGYFGFLISPVATGTFNFGGNSLDVEHSFTQGLSFNYFSDPNRFLSSGRPILIRVEGQNVDVPAVQDSQEFWGIGEADPKFKSIDMGLIAGASFYLNRGLYIMGRMEYGMRDISRNYVDYSYANVNEDGTVQYRNDFDRNVSYQLSIGFRF